MRQEEIKAIVRQGCWLVIIRGMMLLAIRNRRETLKMALCPRHMHTLMLRLCVAVGLSQASVCCAVLTFEIFIWW